MVISSLRWPAAVAAGVGLAFAAASPFIRSGFDSGTSPVAWTVLVVALSVWVPAGYGVLQGEQRFTALGTTLTTGALARLVGGLVLVLLGFGVAGAMAGLAFGYAASAVHVVALALSGGGTRRPEAPPANELPMRPSARSLAVVLVASASTAATTSLDVALVRHLFSAADSGAYTTIAVLGRVVLFGTVAIPFIALPKVSSRAGRGEDPLPVLRWSLLLTAVIAAPLALVIATPIALGLPVLGPNLSGAHAALFWYLAAMVAFSLIITFVYYHLGTGDSFYLLTIAAPAIILQTLLILVVAGSLAEVAQIICAVDVVALMASMIVTFRPRALWRPRLAPHAEPLPEGGFNR